MVESRDKNGCGQQQQMPPEVQLEVNIHRVAHNAYLNAYFALKQQANEMLAEGKGKITAADLCPVLRPCVPTVEIVLKNPESLILTPTLAPRNLGGLKRGG